MIRDRSTVPLTILLAGAIAGALDIVAAIVQNAPTLPAKTVLQSVASGWLGSAAFQGGWPTAWLGLASHFGLMFGLAAVFVFLAVMQPVIRRRWLVAAVVWGALVWLVMSLVVVPLSAAPFPVADSTVKVVTGLITHILAVGLPIAAIARWRLGDGRARPITPG